MKITCESCGFSSEGPDSLSGKKIKCPKCGADFTVGGAGGFTVVEEPVASRKTVLSLKEAPVGTIVGKLGQLEVTNKRVQGDIFKVIQLTNGRKGKERVNIDVLLNLITGITVKRISKLPQRIACFLPALCSLFMALTDGGGAGWACFFLFAAAGYGVGRRFFPDQVWLNLSISGVDHYVRFATSQMKEANDGASMIKNAKAEYERVMGM